jgi:GDP-4-dehydro-6-deoxy-D-mannose reductase
MMKILVTGSNGFVGKHLVREIVKRGHKACGVGREKVAPPEISSLLSEYSIADLTKTEDVARLPLEDVDAVISLAGLARAGDSFKDPEKYLNINVRVVTTLAEEILKRKLDTRYIAISTGAVYGSQQEMPLTEESWLTEQGSPYAKSKILMEQSLDALKKEGLEAVLVRPFNHIGPGQEPGFLVPDLYNEIMLSLKTGEPIKVGDLTTKRDYTDVRDVARAYVNLATAEKLKYDLYNVCSGRSIHGEQILETILNSLKVDKKVTIKKDVVLIRPNDPKDLFGSNKRIREVGAWQPKIPLGTTVRDFLEYEDRQPTL